MSSGHQRFQRSTSVTLGEKAGSSNFLSVDNGPILMAVTKKGRVRRCHNSSNRGGPEDLAERGASPSPVPPPSPMALGSTGPPSTGLFQHAWFTRLPDGKI